MLKKKNIAMAMAAATVVTAVAPATQAFADVVNNGQTEEIKALKEKVYKLVNTKYTTNHNLLADEMKKDGAGNATTEVEITAEDLAEKKVYNSIDVRMGDTSIKADSYSNYAAFEKAFDKAYAEMQNGQVIRVEYSSTYGVDTLEDGQVVNSKEVKYETTVATGDAFKTKGDTTVDTVREVIGTYLDEEVITKQKSDDTYYSKIPVSGDYLTVVKGDAKLDLDKPKFKVVDGYYVDAKGNSIKKFEAKLECELDTVKELVKLGGVVVGYYPVVEANDEIDSDVIAIVKKAEAAVKENLTVGDLYEAAADRLTVKGNELRNQFDIVNNSTKKDNIRFRLTATDKAGEEVLNKLFGEATPGTRATEAELDKLYKDIADAVDEHQVKSIKFIFETTENEEKGTEWSPAYEATITEGRNENFEDIVKAFKGDTEILMHAGLDRYKTAVESSQAGWTKDLAGKPGVKSEHVVLVSGANDKLVDGLAATPLAAVYDAPVLLTKTNEVPKEVLAEIERLGATKVTIVGGTSAVSTDIETKLEKTYGYEVERLSGDGRYETSMAVANKMAELKRQSTDGNEIATKDKFDEVFVVGGKGEADALSASAVAGIKEVPILLTPAGELNADVKTFIQKYVNDNNNDADVYIVGGKNSVNDSVQNKLVDLSIFSNNNKIEVKRLAGEGRQETNAEVIAEFAKMTNPNTQNGKWKFVVANSSNAAMVDALSAGALAAKTGSHIILAGENLTESQEDALKSVNASAWKSRQVGYKVSTAVAKFVGNLIKRP